MTLKFVAITINIWIFTNLLKKEQKELLPLIKKFYKDFGLVGGTAIALHIGHRESIDFDLYFIIKDFHSLPEIIKQAKNIFGNEFNEKICREQLAYFADISYSEEVNYLKGFEVSDKMIKKELVDFSLS